MELKQLVSVMRRRYPILILGMVLFGAVAFFINGRATPTYEASTRLLISQSSSNDLQPSYETLLINERLATTYAELVRARPVLQTVIAHLTLDTTPEHLAEQIDIFSVRDTQLLQLNVRDSEPQRAAETANEIVRVFNAQYGVLRGRQLTEIRQQLERERANLQTIIDRTHARLSTVDASTSDADQRQLEDTLEHSRTSVAALDERLMQLRETNAMVSTSLEVIEAAEPPETPVTPGLMLVTLLATALGGLLAAGGILLFEYVDDTIRDSKTAETLVGSPALALIPRLSNDPSNTFVAATQPQSRATDAFRALGFASGGARAALARSLVVTSVEPETGKSTCSLNLAIVLAQMNKQVILVDANMRSPMLHAVLDRCNTSGLTTALQHGDHAIEELLQETRWPGLKFLFSGPPLDTASDLLGSQRFVEIVEQLQKQADIVLFDTPALETTIDAAAISRHCDTCVLLVQLGQTRAARLQRATQLLAGAAQKLGLVVVDTSLRVRDLENKREGLLGMVQGKWRNIHQRLRRPKWMAGWRSTDTLQQSSYRDD